MPYAGTLEKPLYGVPPTGKFANVDEIVIFRISNEKIIQAGRSTTKPACGANSAPHHTHNSGYLTYPDRRARRCGRTDPAHRRSYAHYVNAEPRYPAEPARPK
jgi:hypothetical protein